MNAEKEKNIDFTASKAAREESLAKGYAEMSSINLELAQQAQVSDTLAWECATEFLRSVKNGDC